MAAAPARRSLLTVLVAACLVGTLLPAAACAATPRPQLRLRHADGILTARLAEFPRLHRGRVRLQVGATTRVKRVRTTRRGRAVVRFTLSSRRRDVTVVARVDGRSRRAVLPKLVATQTTEQPPQISVTGPFGTTAHAPAGDVSVAVGELSQALLDAHPQGTRFVISGGVHRLTSALRPRPGQQLLGMPGATINGAQVVDDFTQRDAVWVSGGHPNRYTTHGSCVSGYDACGRTEAVFVDGAPLWQVTSGEQLAAGRFLFDRATGDLVLFDDPTGKHVELAVAPAAVIGRRKDGTFAPGVVVRNLVVTRFATMAQRGAIDSQGADRWVIDSNDVTFNAGAGVIADSFSVVRGNRISHNGQLGLGGHGVSGLVEGNEIAHNHTGGFNSGWEAGGTKWSRTSDLMVRANYVHHNDGPGLWTDIDNIRTTYDGNVVTDNAEAGIFHEISYDARIEGNRVAGNGFRNPRWGYGAGIQISASGNVLVTGNVVEHNARGITLIQQNRGAGEHGPHEVANVEVSHNTVTMDTGFSGLVQDVGDLGFFTSRNNRFHHNTYVVQGPAKPFEWRNGLRGWTEWAGFHPEDGPFLSE